MVRIGIAGIGFMGMTHFYAAQKLRGGRVEAICTRDPVKLDGDWRAIRGNFGPAGAILDLGAVRRYSRLAELLADPAIDLVSICSPTGQHEAMTLAALNAGKHVLVEKPIALSVDAADRMIHVAKTNGKLLMVGQVLPFFPEFDYLANAVHSKRFGNLLGGHFFRVISRPDWSAAIADTAETGGPAIDLHVHDTHFIRFLCGLPRCVYATGRIEGDAVTHLNTLYDFGSAGPSISCMSGALVQRGRQFAHGFEVYFEQATLAYHSASQPLTLLTADGTVNNPELGDAEPLVAFRAELQAAVDAVSEGKTADVLRAEFARDALQLCHLECQSVRERKPMDLVRADA